MLEDGIMTSLGFIKVKKQLGCERRISVLNHFCSDVNGGIIIGLPRLSGILFCICVMTAALIDIAQGSREEANSVEIR